MEAVILVGIQATGKSTFYASRFAHTHVRINLDMLKTRHREQRFVEMCIETGQPFVVDNTNPTPDERARYIAPARATGFRIVGYFFRSRIDEAVEGSQLGRRTGKRQMYPGGQSCVRPFTAPD
jgi:predicted kinase